MAPVSSPRFWVMPCGFDAAEQPGKIPRSLIFRVPAKAESISVDRLGSERRIQRLRNQQVLGVQDQLGRPQRLPAVR
jgi:hypothetical protein